MTVRKPVVYPLLERLRGPTRPTLDLPDDASDDPVKFYRQIGCPFRNSKTNERITELAPYQVRTVRNHQRHRKLLVLKSQKIGLSSLGIVITLCHALTDCMGYELIVFAQNKDQAIQHGRDFRRFLAASKYRDYLVTRPSQVPGMLRDEVSTMTNIFMVSRHGGEPTHIHILSPSASAVASLKRVKFVWCSDITFVEHLPARQRNVFAALSARLTMTEGPIFIECPTVGHLGPIYEIDDSFQERQKAKIPQDPHDFFVDRITVWEAVKAGVLSMAMVQGLKREHGPAFPALFEAVWGAGGAAWYTPDQFVTSKKATELANI